MDKVILDLDQIVEQAHSLEPLPASAAKLAGLVASPEPDLQEIWKVVEQDPPLTVALLRRANSAANAASRSVATVKDAVMRLGAAGVLQVVTRQATRPVLEQALPEYGLAAGQLWEHSRAAAIATELIGKASRRRLPPESSTTALLHDIGKIVLARFLDVENRELLDRAYQALRSYRLAEREVLGVSQAELGGLLAERWQLPVSIVLGITHYHAPQEYANTLGAEEHVLTICHAVHFANFLAKCNDTAGAELRTDSRIPVERTASVDAFTGEILGSMEFLGINPALFSGLLGELRVATHHLPEA